MSLNQPLLLSSALVHQVLLSPTTYPYKQVAQVAAEKRGFGNFTELVENAPFLALCILASPQRVLDSLGNSVFARNLRHVFVYRAAFSVSGAAALSRAASSASTCCAIFP